MIPDKLFIDGTPSGERYVVHLNGIIVLLTSKSFKFLAKLAWKRSNSQTGWLCKEELENGFNQARYIYRLKGEIKEYVELLYSIIENNRLGSYRLKIEPENIKFNFDLLQQHHDYDVRAIATAKSTT